jgi:hypothetical protein
MSAKELVAEKRHILASVCKASLVTDVPAKADV